VFSCAKQRVAEDLGGEGCGGLDLRSLNDQLVECAPGPGQRRRAIGAPHDELGQQAVLVRGDGVASECVGIDTGEGTSRGDVRFPS
jgi:hypothetical protein